MGDVTRFPTTIQRLFKQYQDEKKVFEIIHKDDLLCETQYMLLTEKKDLMEQVYVINTDRHHASYKKKCHREAKGLILDSDANFIARSIPPVFDSNSKLAAKLNWGRGVVAEEFIHGTVVMIFNYGGRLHVTTEWDATGMEKVEWNDKLTVQEAVSAILGQMYNPWQLPFSDRQYKGKYVWIFILAPPRGIHRNGELYFVGAINKETNSEIKAEYLNRFAFTWELKRPVSKKMLMANSIEDAVAILPEYMSEAILRDDLNNRVKIKNPVAEILRHLNRVPAVSLNKIAELVLLCSSKKLQNLMPELTNLFYIFEDTLEDYMEEIDNLWNYLCKGRYTSRREFAQRALSYDLSYFMFLAYDGKVKNGREMLKCIRPRQLVNWVKDTRGNILKNELDKVNSKREEETKNGSKSNEAG